MLISISNLLPKINLALQEDRLFQTVDHPGKKSLPFQILILNRQCGMGNHTPIKIKDNNKKQANKIKSIHSPFTPQGCYFSKSRRLMPVFAYSL